MEDIKKFYKYAGERSMSLSWGLLVSAAKGAYAKVKNVVKKAVNYIQSTKTYKAFANTKIGSAIIGMTATCIKSLTNNKKTSNSSTGRSNNIFSAVFGCQTSICSREEKQENGVKQSQKSKKTDNTVVYKVGRIYKDGERVKKLVNGYMVQLGLIKNIKKVLHNKKATNQRVKILNGRFIQMI